MGADLAFLLDLRNSTCDVCFSSFGSETDYSLIPILLDVSPESPCSTSTASPSTTSRTQPCADASEAPNHTRTQPSNANSGQETEGDQPHASSAELAAASQSAGLDVERVMSSLGIEEEIYRHFRAAQRFDTAEAFVR